MHHETYATKGEFGKFTLAKGRRLRSYFAKRHTCMSVTRCGAHSGQMGASDTSVRVAIEKTETSTFNFYYCSLILVMTSDTLPSRRSHDIVAQRLRRLYVLPASFSHSQLNMEFTTVSSSGGRRKLLPWRRSFTSTSC